VLEVAALAECQEVGAGVVGRVVIEVSAGEDDMRPARLDRPGGQGRKLWKPPALAGMIPMLPPRAAY